MMPFKRYTSTFTPQTLEALQAAFDLAWGRIATIPVVSTDPDAARELLAQRIVKAAQEIGSTDPGRLANEALKAFEP